MPYVFNPFTGNLDLIISGAVPQGGTGATTFTDHGVLIGHGTSPLTATAAGATGTVLIGQSGADPIYSGAPTLSTSLTSPLVIGGAAVGSSLELRSTSAVGTTDFVTVTVGNAGTTEALRVIHSGFVGIGTTTPLTKLHVLDTISTSPRGVLSGQISTDTAGARVGFSKARGAAGAETTIVTGDTLGRLMFRGYDGANYLEMGSIEVGASGTIAATRVPTFLAFSTATNAAPSVLTEALRIDNAQKIGIGTITPGAKVDIAGGTVTVDTPLLNLSQTWNNAATVFSMLKIDVVPTAFNVGTNAMGSTWLLLTKSSVLNFEVGIGNGGNAYTYITGGLGAANGPGYFGGITGDIESRFALQSSPTASGQAQLSFGPGNGARTIAMFWDGNRPALQAPIDFTDNGQNVLGRTSFTAVNGNPALAAGPSKGWTIYTNDAAMRALDITSAGTVGVQVVSPGARFEIIAGSATAGTAPIKLNSGAVLTVPVAGVLEFLTDDYFATITTGPARKAFVLDDGARLTSGRVPFATTNGRLVDDSDLTFATDTLSVTKVTMGGPLRLKGYTVGTLPAGTQGDTAFATDLLTPTYLVAAVGGGAVVGKVFYNGSAWVCD